MLLPVIRWIQAHPARAGAIAGWYQQACSGLAALVVLPMIVRRLGESDAGIWFAFQAVITVVNLTDFGLSFVMTRQVAFSLGSKGGNEEANFQGDFIRTRQGWAGVSDVYALCRQIFRWITLLALPVVVVTYEFVLPQGKLLAGKDGGTSTAWYLLGAAALLALLCKPHQALLDGLGKVFATRLLSGSQLLLGGLGAVIVLGLGGGLVAMASALLLAGVLHYAALRWSILHLRSEPLPAPIQTDWRSIIRFAKVSLPMGVLNLSAFLVSSIQVPLVGSLLGAHLVPGYYFAQRLSQMVNLAVMQLVAPQLPLFTHQLAEQKFADASRRVSKTAGLVFLLSGIANGFFLLGSPIFADWWMGPGHYVSSTALAIMAVDGWLMASAVVWAQFVLCAGTNPFVWSTMISGVLNLALITLLADRFSVAGIAGASLLAGLAVNYWYVFICGMGLLKKLRQACIR